jgi:hypothetical protein
VNNRPIIDAGPALNFLSINRERLLISVLGPLSSPETVENEVLRKAKVDTRFTSVEQAWRRLKPNLLTILSDDTTRELSMAVNRISGLPLDQRQKQLKDLGEIMVIAHVVVAAEAGAEVIVLIDDSNGAYAATREIDRLSRRQAQGHPVGSIKLVSTLTVLELAAGGNYLPSRKVMRDLCDKLRSCDNGLPPIEYTRLLSPELWAHQ